LQVSLDYQIVNVTNGNFLIWLYFVY
jgi:hypothetical protein